MPQVLKTAPDRWICNLDASGGGILSQALVWICLGFLVPVLKWQLKKLSQYFLSKHSSDKLSWLIVICLRKFFGFLLKVVFRVQVWVFLE